MKRLLLKILIFLLPIPAIVFLFPVNERLKFTGLKDDCFYHGIWIFDRIEAKDKPVDIVFLGSSHTVNGIMDGEIENAFSVNHLHAVNLGYCRYGNNFNYALLKIIVKKQDPKIIVLEVREDEDRYSHPVFPYIADAGDVFLAWPFFNRDMVSDMFNAFLYRMRLIRNYYLRSETVPPVNQERFGYAASQDTIPVRLLDQLKQKQANRHWLQPGLLRDFYMAYPRAYLEKISRLCRTNNIRLVFLYLPEYGSTLIRPLEWDTYNIYGRVLIPPGDILNNVSYWHDETHLNGAGAKQLSSWVAEQLQVK